MASSYEGFQEQAGRLDLTVDQQKPLLSPEAEQAFDEIITYIERQATKIGTPIEVTGKMPAGFQFHTEEFCTEANEPFKPNAAGYRKELFDAEYKLHLTRIELLGEEATEKTKELGMINIYLGNGSHPSDVYMLHTDKSIERFRLTSEYDGMDEDGYKINWRERIYSLGLLDTYQTKDLLQTLSGQKAFIVEPDELIIEKYGDKRVDEDYMLDLAEKEELEALHEAEQELLEQDKAEREAEEAFWGQYWDALEENEAAEREAYLNGDDQQDDDPSGYMEARCGITDAESVAIAAEQDLEREMEERGFTYFDFDDQDEEDEEDNEDPLAGEVDLTGGYDNETEYVDVRDLEINEDEFGNAVDGHGNLIYPEDQRH